MKIGITGHQHLPDQNSWNWVKLELSKLIFTLASNSETIGLSSLAIGVDQLFSRLLLNTKGTLYVIMPFAGYERTFNTEKDLSSYNELLSQASNIDILQPKETDEESFFNAGKIVVSLCDILIAVWNGEQAQGLGGTADVVKYAKSLGKPVIHLNTTTLTITNL